MSTPKQALRKPPELIRNICILAHVDHGKTTLADSLVASNGIISKRLAGKMRYMDSRRDEQERGITMKSSSIALAVSHNSKNYMVNLIDSPGHVDFSIEVSTAVRLCDGALVLVDVIEGVCPQTRAALYQAWREGLRPILVLNKFDRLIVELQMDILAAYVHLQQILEQVNVIMSELHTTNIFEKQTQDEDTKDKDPSGQETTERNYYDEWTAGLDDCDDSDLYFSPDQNNVIFSSALDGWAFTIQVFARFLSNKLKIREALLQKTLWGDFYLDMKNKRIQRGAMSKGKKPLFVSLVLENIWKAYEAIVIRKDEVLMDKIIATLDVKLTDRERKSISNSSVGSDSNRTLLRNIFGQWLPLAKTVLDEVVELIPSPCQLSDERIQKIMCPLASQRFDSLPESTKMLKDHLMACKSSPIDSNEDIPTIVCVSKMFAIERKSLPENRSKPLTAEEIKLRREEYLKSKEVKFEETISSTVTLQELERNQSEVVFIAFARVLSGTIRVGDDIYVLGPKHKPGLPAPKVLIKQLYMLMGREMEHVDEVCAGNVVGIGGLETHVLKSATLSSTLHCPALIDLHMAAAPILRVALEVDNPSDMQTLIGGLRLLGQADPSVEVKIQESGEHVLITTGEVHLDKCVTDLRERFARGIEFKVSKPIVPFRETVVPHVQPVEGASSDDSTLNNSKKEIIIQHTADRRSTIKLSVKPLPREVTDLLEEHSKLIKFLSLDDKRDDSQLPQATIDTLEELKSNLDAAFKQSNPKDFPIFHSNMSDGQSIADRIWSFGPKHCGPNMLINFSRDFHHRSIWTALNDETQQFKRLQMTDESSDKRKPFERSLVSGFQLASLSGPLCDEPLMGVAFVVHDWIISLSEDDSKLPVEDNGAIESSKNNVFGPLSGQIISATREACRRALEAVLHQQRLVAAMYSCTIQINAEALGKMYAVINRRHGRVLHDDLMDGSRDQFTITCEIPVVESFHFGDELRKQTSGLANPQLIFAGWQVIDIDPHWVPSTVEELEEFGESGSAGESSANRALAYVSAVRRRKGLQLEEHVVQHAEKQRTLKK